MERLERGAESATELGMCGKRASERASERCRRAERGAEPPTARGTSWEAGERCGVGNGARRLLEERWGLLAPPLLLSCVALPRVGAHTPGCGDPRRCPHAERAADLATGESRLIEVRHLRGVGDRVARLDEALFGVHPMPDAVQHAVEEALAVARGWAAAEAERVEDPSSVV